MAIATSTLLAAGALAATAASTGMSFAQAGKQKQAQRNAERDAEQAMQEARKKLEINFYDNLEDSRLRDIGTQLDLGEVEGAQLAAANAQELRARSMEQGMQGVTSLGKQAVSYIPLFSGKDAVTPDVSPSNMNLNSLQQPNNQPMNFNSLNQPYQFKPLYQKPFQQPFSLNPFNLPLPK